MFTIHKVPPHGFTLTYLNLKAMGEPIRWIFKYAQVPFDDIRIELSDWPAEKPRFEEIGVGQVPTLQVGSKLMTQSLPIARFVCNQFKLVADKPFLNYRSDEVIHVVEDLRYQCRPTFMKLFKAPRPEELDDELKNLRENVAPKYFRFLDKLVGGTEGPFIAGDKATVGDFVLGSWLDIHGDVGILPASELEKYPNLKALKDNLLSNPQIKEWIETRPKTLL